MNRDNLDDFYGDRYRKAGRKPPKGWESERGSGRGCALVLIAALSVVTFVATGVAYYVI